MIAASRHGFWVVVILVILLFTALVVRLWYVQVIKDDGKPKTISPSVTGQPPGPKKHGAALPHGQASGSLPSIFSIGVITFPARYDASQA
jgi:hypothetical protein